MGDLKRKGSFFLGTLAFYGVLLLAAGVGSIYAYNARLADRDDGEIVTLMSFARTPREERAEPVRRSAATRVAPQGGGMKAQPAIVTEIAKNSPHLSDRSVASETSRDLPPNMDYKLGDHNFIPPAGFGDGKGDKPGDAGRDTGPVVDSGPGDDAPRIVKTEPTPAPTPKQEVKKVLQLSQGVITAKATAKPAPPYPNIAKMARAQGPVTVQIVVDEHGRVIASKATGGHPLLRGAAEQAAFQARFTPTFLSGQPVKVTGVITYNFVLN
ncbi:MAG: TonB family protein [Acidobacteria bacterium]|nr:TonB family protein [Acidobacteriota bacterium]